MLAQLLDALYHPVIINLSHEETTMSKRHIRIQNLLDSLNAPHEDSRMMYVWRALVLRHTQARRRSILQRIATRPRHLDGKITYPKEMINA